MFDFVPREQVHLLHERLLIEHGGSSGVRNHGSIESAPGSAQNAFFYGGRDEFDVAAYAFHLAESQAFLDGNKRTGLGTALYFLSRNAHTIKTTPGDQITLYDAMIATHEPDKAGLAALLRRLFGR